jgi:4-amino-4-deoxy-L-arabinose transferase-like glycosyltransferase
MSDVVAAAPDLAPAPTPAGRIASTLGVAILIGAAWVVLQLYGLSLTPFYTTGEPREAVVVQDIVQRGNLILPRRDGVQLAPKPPLFYWLSAIAARARGGVDEASVRLPSALLSGAACLLVAGVATNLWGAVAGAITGLTLLTSFEWLRAATEARVDMTLAFGLTLVFVGLLLFRSADRRAGLLIFYVGMAWATLSKGIPGLAIPALQVLLLCLLVDRSLAFAWQLRLLIGLPIVLLVAGAWYVAAAAQAGRQFISLVVSENLVRTVGAQHFTLGHRHSVMYLVVVLLCGLLPWTVLLPSVGLALWRERRTIDRRDPRLFSLLWILSVFAPYAVAVSKRSVYLLPLYPAVSLLVGWWASRAVFGVTPSVWLLRILTVLGWVFAVALGTLLLLAGAQAVGVPLLDVAAQLLDPIAARDLQRIAAAGHAAGPGLAVYLALAAAAAAAVACFASARRWGASLVALYLCAGILIVAVRLIALPAISEVRTQRPFVAALRRTVVDPSQVETTASLDYGTLFYWGEPMPIYDRSASGAAPRYLILPRAAWLRMSPAERRSYRRVPGLSVPDGDHQGHPAVIERLVGDQLRKAN